MSQSDERSDRIRVVLFCLVVPIIVWSTSFFLVKLNALAFNDYRSAGSTAASVLHLAHYLVFAAQLAIIAWTVGRYIHHPVLRCAVFLWCIVLVDVLFVYFRYSSYYGVLRTAGYAFASAQLGLLFTWAILGRESTFIRVTSALLGTGAVILYERALTTGFTSVPRHWMENDWGTILAVQGLATCGLCTALRLRRYRLILVGSPSETASVATDEADANTQLQFSILHVLIWTSALAPLFAALRLVDWAGLEVSAITYWLEVATFGAVVAIGQLVLIWAGLGRGGVALRILVPLASTAAIGVGMASLMEREWLDRIDFDVILRTRQSAYLFWISWVVLGGFLYLAMLLVLRATNHRLARTDRSGNEL